MRTNRSQDSGNNVDKATIKQLTALMADTVVGIHNSRNVNFFATPLFGDKEDLAYLQGSRAINSLRLSPFGIRKLERHFKDALSIRGLCGLDADIHVAKFRVYYWSVAICKTNGARRQRARRKVKKFRSIVDKLTDQTSRDMTLSG